MANEPLDGSIASIIETNVSFCTKPSDLLSTFNIFQKMDYTDIDQVMEVPDTPDRLASQQKVTFAVSDDTVNNNLLTRGIHHGQRGCHGVNASNANNKKLLSHHQRDLDIHGEINNGISLFGSASNSASVTNENWISKKNEISLIKETHITEPVPRHKKFSLNMPSIPQGSTNHPVERAKLRISSSNDTGDLASDVKIQCGNRRRIIDSSQNALDSGFLRGTVKDTNRKMHLDLQSSNAEINISTDIPGSFICQEVDCVSNIPEQPKYTGKPDRSCSAGGLRKTEDRDLTVGSVFGLIQESRSKSQLPTTDGPFNNVDSFSRASSQDCKREGILHGAGVSMSGQNVNGGLACDVKGKGIDLCIISPQKSGQFASIALNAMPSRKPGQRKLVRNGCISPFNIAKSKIASENIGKNIKDDKQDKNAKTTCSNLSGGNSSCPIYVTLPTSEVKQVDRVKGKGIIDASMPENYHNIRPRPLSCREEDFGSGDATCDIFKSAEETGGWRSTRQSSKIAHSSSSHDIKSHSSSELFHHNHKSRREDSAYMTAANFPETDSCSDGDPIIIHDSGSSTHQTQAPSSIIFESNPDNRSHKGKQKLVKRPRRVMTSCNDTVESSRLPPNDPEVLFLQSSGQPSTIKRNITVKSQQPSNLVPIVEVNEPCTSQSVFTESQNLDSIFGDNSDSRARQVEADEMLARQLQEQFYSEFPETGSAEIDANLAWSLQHEEDAGHSSFLGNRRLSRARDSTGRHSYRGHPTSHILSTRPTSSSRGYTSARMRQLRRSLYDHSHLSSRGRSLNFPPNMDAETRIDILEALEAAVSNRNNRTNRTNMTVAGRLFQVQRDFNENDYEMLLALDDENHRHVGASLNQINSLPQSVIQTNDFEEACAICLETPSIGDTIRHLPCLHKFHKECIDLWLRRKTSCPICKSSVT